MKCPICHTEMEEKDFGRVGVDVCRNCKGLWFDWLELIKLDENNEGFGHALKEALQYPRSNDENREQLQCPRCYMPMHRHIYRSSKEINVDECYSCGGFFLDSGELKEMRDNFMTEEEEEAYFKKLLDNSPASRQLDRDLEKEEARTKAIRRYTRFLRLSYYLTKK